MVNKISAQLHLRNETRIPVRGNHTQLVKFSMKSDPAYQVFLKHIRDCLAEFENYGTY